MDLKKCLPDNYGNIITNFTNIEDGKIGIVIPTFGRENYVKRTLESIADSNLENCILCLIDETNCHCNQLIPNFTEFNNVDSDSYDIINKSGMNIQELSYHANNDTNCIAFNSNGWLKYKLNDNLKEFKSNSNLKFYIRNDIINKDPSLKQKMMKYLPKDNKNYEIEKLLFEFNINNIPIIKIFKNKHGNMFDSLKVGWDLLFNHCKCSKVMCLDSDTIVKQNWIIILNNLYEIIAKDNEYFIISGFNSTRHPSHKIIKEESNYYIKYGIGGLNMFFSQKTYENIVRETLTSVSWDHVVVDKLNKKGVFICSKPSVINHTGEYGLWSKGKNSYDTSIDF